ncbi:hypothetical protein [Chitinophaga sp.]|uniref:hypothetical protein n=1 Tax=Chitinophaga sp. TaxID=1869181 RepID=UPI002F9557CE
MKAGENKVEYQEKVIPIMGCPDIRAQVDFYKALGFEVLGLYTSPNPYAALKWQSIELHFYGSRKIVPSENPAICFLLVKDVDQVNRSFTEALKNRYGKIPRSGFPKITKVRDLSGDRRFTLTDTGGNTLYIGMPATEEDKFFRKLDNQEYTKPFEVLYDILYSREDPELANNMLPKYSAMAGNLAGLDKAKYLLVLADIQKQLDRNIEDAELHQLIADNSENSGDWKKIQKRFLEILDQ